MDIVVGAVPDEARVVIERVAAEQGAVIIDANADAPVTGSHVEGGTVTIDTPEDRYGPLALALRGRAPGRQCAGRRAAARGGATPRRFCIEGRD